MKLYATITNEKGKKEGIGSNEYLDIDIRAGNKLIAMFTLKEDENGDITLFDEDDEPVTQSYTIKGKSQKGECLHKNTFNYMGKIHCTKCKEYLN